MNKQFEASKHSFKLAGAKKAVQKVAETRQPKGKKKALVKKKPNK